MRRKSLLYYHLGLSLFSVFPAVIVLLATHQWYPSLFTVLIVNLFGVFRNNVFLSISFHVLKLIAGMLGEDGFAPEEMVITLGSHKTLRKFGGRVPASKILLLLPHCLQMHDCTRRITHNPFNCVRCGKCPIAGLLDLVEKKGVKIAVATGGTLARRHIKESRPMVVVAVACPRDLGQGMLDAHPVPVVGVKNTRPVGDCIDTCVDVNSVEEAIDSLTSGTVRKTPSQY